MENIKLTANSAEILAYCKANGEVPVEEIATAVGRTARSVNANITDLQKKGFVVRDKREVEGADKPVTYVLVTADGMAFTPAED